MKVKGALLLYSSLHIHPLTFINQAWGRHTDRQTNTHMPMCEQKWFQETRCTWPLALSAWLLTSFQSHLYSSKTKGPDIQVARAHISSKAFNRTLGFSCAEYFSLKFLHDVIMPITAMHTWPGCYNSGLLVVKHWLALKELCDVMKISSTKDNH